MFPLYRLCWFFQGSWQEIGWRAGTPDSFDGLKQHGQALADSDPRGRYRIERRSHLLNGGWECCGVEFVAQDGAA